MSKFDMSPEFAERLGAYIEGNLSYEEAYRMELLINENEDLGSFVNELHEESLIGFSDFATYDYCCLESNFALPELPNYRFGGSDGIYSDATNIFEDYTMNLWNEDRIDCNQWGDDTDFFGNNDNDLII